MKDLDFSPLPGYLMIPLLGKSSSENLEEIKKDFQDSHTLTLHITPRSGKEVEDEVLNE